MTTVSDPSTNTAAPRLRPGSAIRLDPAAPSLWRVVDAAGRIIGHLLALRDDTGVRYRARRFHAGVRRFLDLGDFWSADDAVECLRYSR
ncbi:hypothetical protein QL996_00960 [Planococcus sp. APC 4015]|nr:hypothetical protein [Planococcus sp. APC 4015]